MSKTIIIIPSRLAAKRLPQKPLMEINGIPMIVQTYRRALESNCGDVYVASSDDDILNVIKNFKGKSMLTGEHHLTGSDRVYEAYKKINDEKIDLIINLQGDMPNIDPNNILKLNKLMRKNNSQMGTLASKITNNSEMKDFNIVKVKTEETLNHKDFLKVKDFFRIGDSKNSENIYHHIGIYAFKPDVLKKYINLKRSKNEIDRNLEQMRALDNSIKIDVSIVSSAPLSVDTQKELEEVRSLMNLKK